MPCLFLTPAYGILVTMSDDIQILKEIENAALLCEKDYTRDDIFCVLRFDSVSNPEIDIVEYNGKKIQKVTRKVYILLNKPIGYVTTVKEQFNRDSVLDLVKDVKTRVVPVGRLDMYTSGALLFSNDGDFVNKITHPSNEIEKTYNVTVIGKVTDEEVTKLQDGIQIEVEGETYTTKKAKYLK